MITAGIDCGAKNTKAVILVDGKIAGKSCIQTGFEQKKAIADSFEKAIEAAGIEKNHVDRIGATGSGKDLVEFDSETVDDIKAIATAAYFYFPSARTVIDVGAEEARAVRIDQNGNPVDFALNERCAAGTGSFIDAMARALEISIEEMGSLCMQSENDIQINSQCVIFAESEVIGLIHAKVKKADICKAIHDAMASRIASIIRRVGIAEDVVMVGGLGRNQCLINGLLRNLKIKRLLIPEYPEYSAAVGAAIIASEEAGELSLVSEE